MGSSFEKRSILAALSACLIAASASAQGLSVDVGFKGGLNLSSFHGTEIGNSETRPGHIVGAFAYFDFGGLLIVQPEAYYSRRGAKEPEIFTEQWGSISNAVWNYNYLDFVGLLKLRVTPRRLPYSVSLFTGPVVSFLVGAKATGLKDTRYSCCPPQRVPGESPYVNPLNYNTRGNDFGGTVGVGLGIDLGPTKISLDTRYTRMTKEFDEAPYDDLYSRKHSAFSFQVGVSLTPSAWSTGRRRPRRPVVSRPPPVNTIVLMERITREDIAARRESFSAYDIIRLERPQWVDAQAGTVRGTLFVDGQPWVGSAEVLRNRRGSDIQEVRRMEGAPGPYRGYGVVIEIITR